MSTAFLEEAFGVFEGGGVRGLAYLGVLKAAFEQKVRFCGAAGTSVGSIAAALVAAGIDEATLDRVIDSIKPDFFVRNPKLLPGWRAPLATLATAVMPGRLGKAAMLAAHLGLNSSDGVREWMNTTLIEIMNKRLNKPFTRPVTFKDIDRPLAIFATDLSGANLKVWRSYPDRLPGAVYPEDDVEVAFAVQCSCAIPLFYQPVWDKYDEFAYLDGGAIANLPIFLTEMFPDLLDMPVLAFRLGAEPPKNVRKKGLKVSELIKRTIEAIVAGNADLQLYTHSRAAEVRIDTRGVSSTDFQLAGKKRARLIRRGNKTFTRFLNTPASVAQFTDRFKETVARSSRAGVLDEMATLIKTAHTRVAFSIRQHTTIIALAPAIQRARQIFGKSCSGRGALPSIHIIYSGEAFAKAKAIAVPLGCDIVEATPSCRPLYNGMVADGDRLLIIEREDGATRYVRLFSRHDPHYADLVKLFSNHFDECWTTLGPNVAYGAAPVVVPLDNQQRQRFFSAMRQNVSQYREPGIEMTLTDLDPLRILPRQKVLQAWRIKRIRDIHDYCLASGNLVFCEPAWLKGSARVSCPPVVEQRGGEYVLIRGHHRTYYSIVNDMPRQKVVLVTGVNALLPSSPLEAGWKDVRTVNRPLSVPANPNPNDRDISAALEFLGRQLP